MNRKPVAKVTAAGVGGAVVIVGVWVASLFGIEVPGEVGAAMATIAAFGAGYMKKP